MFALAVVDVEAVEVVVESVAVSVCLPVVLLSDIRRASIDLCLVLPLAMTIAIVSIEFPLPRVGATKPDAGTGKHVNIHIVHIDTMTLGRQTCTRPLIIYSMHTMFTSTNNNQ